MTSLNVGEKIIFGDENACISNNSGVLELVHNPTTAMGIATKSYVDNALPVDGHVCTHHTARGLAQTGTINTGSVDNLTLGTALPTTYDYGIWLYLPAIATTPAITAGFYYCIATNTTTLTIFNNDTIDKEPYDFTVGSAFTGTTSEITMYTDTVYANTIGNNGHLIGKTCIIHTASANTKTYRWKFGGTLTNVTVNTTATSYLYTGYTTIFNQGNPSRQIGNRSFSTGSVGALPYRATVNTTANQPLTLTMQRADATEYLIVEGYCVTVDYVE